MISIGRKALFFLILLSLPILFWIIPNNKIHFITFLGMVIFYLGSRHWKAIAFFSETFEIILLLFSILYLWHEIGLEKLFPANNIATLILLYLFLTRLKRIDRTELFLVRGNSKGTLLFIILFSLLSIISLATWFIFQNENPYVEFIPNLPIPVLIISGIGFAIINAIYEEGIFRSILFSYFSKELGVIGAAILQSIWFSLLHYQAGFPSGIIGIGLTFIFGLMMGYLVYRTRGLLVPIIIHALADFAIFILVILKMHNVI
jgi:membrane protease YdiL (CAAX protease family)